MSGLLLTNQNQITVIDRRIEGEVFWNDLLEIEIVNAGFVESGFVSPFWPRGSALCGDSGGDAFGLHPFDRWDIIDVTSGASSRFGVVGVTRDVYGSPLAGCTVKLFRTSTDELVASVVSDPVGNYLVTTPYYPDAHYLVVYKTSSPDVFGTSVNTIIAG